MLKALDEILIKYAASFDDLPVSAPEPPRPGELISIEPTKSEEGQEQKLPTPIPLPVEHRPLSQRDIEEEIPEPPVGTPEYDAKHYTQEFLKGTKQPYRGWIRDPKNKGLTIRTMDSLVKDHPEDYFSWDLHRRQELTPWLYPAGKRLIERDPTLALMKEIWLLKV